MNDETRSLYDARKQRVLDAIELRVPDRVPISTSFYFFPARLYGYTVQDLMYDPEKLMETHLRATLEFQPDLAQNPIGLLYLGPLLDALDYRQMLWAGRQLGPDVPFQFVEGEYMKVEEYDHFLSEPGDFIVRKYWPRISGVFGAFGKLPPFRDFTNFMSYRSFGMFGTPEMQEALDAIMKAGRATAQIGEYSSRFEERMVAEGFPTQTSGSALAPFDQLGDFFRGTKGLMLDMYRRPDMVLKAVEKLLPLEIDRGVNSAKRLNSNLVYIPLHKGVDSFMSQEQFRKFYWPTLRALMMGLIEEGLTPYLFWEGECTSRLDLIKDVPAGKVIYRFETTDMLKAKDVLRDRVCIRGNVPISVLATGTTDDVKECCRKLIDYVGQGGGFILDASAGVNDAKPENLRTMHEFCREYGVYRS